jgi:hypothetical protein
MHILPKHEFQQQNFYTLPPDSTPIKSPQLKMSPGECPFGKGWNFIWHRFIRVL